jgi:predicted acylesterase/phospholipase RssA
MNIKLITLLSIAISIDNHVLAISSTHLHEENEDSDLFAEEEYAHEEVPFDGKCRALALRGGGTNGAYEVGVL